MIIFNKYFLIEFKPDWYVWPELIANVTECGIALLKQLLGLGLCLGDELCHLGDECLDLFDIESCFPWVSVLSIKMQKRDRVLI